MLCWLRAACALAAASAASRSSAGCGAAAAALETFATTFNGDTYTHELTLPASSPEDHGAASPRALAVYFHSWGGEPSEARPFAAVAAARGVATLAVQGVGDAGWRSWNAAGSAASPGRYGRTCVDGSPDYCWEYADCYDAGGGCGDGCWWTTCADTVAHALDALAVALDATCVDLDRIWAVGCSNGGLMVHELLADERAASFAGGATVVAAPHGGFARPPARPAHLVGLWGSSDRTIPPVSNTDRADVVLDTRWNGWYYTSARNTTGGWSEAHGGPRAPTSENVVSDDVSCSSFDGGSVDVVECLFDGGHVCNAADDVLVDFIASRRRLADAPSAAPSAPSGPPAAPSDPATSSDPAASSPAPAAAPSAAPSAAPAPDVEHAAPTTDAAARTLPSVYVGVGVAAAAALLAVAGAICYLARGRDGLRRASSFELVITTPAIAGPSVVTPIKAPRRPRESPPPRPPPPPPARDMPPAREFV